MGPATPATPQYPFAPIDQYVADKCGRDGVARYRAAVTELFLSNRFALGDPAILHAYDLLVRVALLFVTARYVFADSAPGGGAGPPVAGVTGLVGLLDQVLGLQRSQRVGLREGRPGGGHLVMSGGEGRRRRMAWHLSGLGRR